MEIAEQIIDKIQQGQYQEGQKLPTIIELTKQFGTGRNTIKKALDILATEGYTYRNQGSGIYIRQNTHHDYINLGGLSGIGKDFSDDVVISTDLIDLLETTADSRLAEKMKCQIGTPLYFVSRLRKRDGKPFDIEFAFFNREIITYLNQEIVETSIYNYIQNVLKLSIGFSDKIFQIEALNATNAALLGLKTDDPALVIEEAVYLKNGYLFNYSFNYYHKDNAKFYIQSEHRG
jgi:GntR family transcriptional regulator of bglA